MVLIVQDSTTQEQNQCSGHCKAIIRRITEQVKAEKDQWSQMQEMLNQVREEMEELQVSREFWKDQALESESQIQSLQSSVRTSLCNCDCGGRLKNGERRR